ncbi:MAG: type II secretion system GspH family protein, partial [Pirellulales bacterium]|nr:type II secretion system GspH family protein [Pirellulales bacterium]
MKRNAHSLIEMLVVLIVVSILIAILVPAVQRSRESARMAQCISNQGELTKAVQLYVAADRFGHYPGYRASTGDGDVIGWAAQLFEYLGRSDLSADPTQATYVEVLVCPSDSGPRNVARLNYVVNGGQAGNDSPADGIFFDHAKD